MQFDITGPRLRVGYAKWGTIIAGNETSVYINKRYYEAKKFNVLVSKCINDYEIPKRYCYSKKARKRIVTQRPKVLSFTTAYVFFLLSLFKRKIVTKCIIQLYTQ